jgi:glycerol-3-phosphate acyltransferase PlsY
MSRLYYQLLTLIPIAYLLGSIPFGLLVARSRGKDPRLEGSKNIGATNVGRLLGGKFFALVFTLDLSKSLLPMLLAGAFVHAHFHHGDNILASIFLLWISIGFAAILGHVFPIFLRFKGGKGVATSAGVFLGLFPYYTLPGLLAIAVFIVVFLAKRYVSLASILAAAAFPLAYIAVGQALHWPVFHQQLPLLLFALLVASLVILKHRTNISRLLAGTEHSFKKK